MLKRGAGAEHGPSLAGLGQAAALGATAGGGIGLAQAIWVKHREGRSPFRGEFSTQDWRDVGVVAAQGASGGAVAGGALYVVTNSTVLAAPFAGSLVSGLMGIGGLLRDYDAGTIDCDQFVEMAHIIALDAAIAGLATSAGQTLIPIPLLGALIGSLAGKFVASALKDGLGKSESALTARLAKYEQYALGQLDEEFRAFMQQLDTRFGNLERLAEAAFDQSVNASLRLRASIVLAETVGVPDARILQYDRRSRYPHDEVNMDPLSNPLDGLSPELYVATLSKIAHADGLHPAERELLDHHAAHFGVDLDNLPVVPDDLSALPWATRVLVYRDAVTLALIDDEMSAGRTAVSRRPGGANGVTGRHGRSDLLVGAGLRNTARASGQVDQCTASVLIQSRRRRAQLCWPNGSGRPWGTSRGDPQRSSP